MSGILDGKKLFLVQLTFAQCWLKERGEKGREGEKDIKRWKEGGREGAEGEGGREGERERKETSTQTNRYSQLCNLGNTITVFNI